MWVDHGILGQGNKMWPGLYKKSPAPELFEEYASGTTTNEAAHKAWFEWEKWAGIDCEGLALHGLRYAYRPEVYATEQQVEEQNTEIPGIVIGDVCNSANCAIKLPILSDGWQGALLNINVTKFFNPANTGFLYQWQRTEDSQKLIHKGDFAHYDGHISTVYSERWGKTIFNTRDYPNINYDVIHAYGNSLYHQDFSRKVIITGNDIIIPIGFGRIKLWN
jgi:hypothetical protein